METFKYGQIACARAVRVATKIELGHTRSNDFNRSSTAATDAAAATEDGAGGQAGVVVEALDVRLVQVAQGDFGDVQLGGGLGLHKVVSVRWTIIDPGRL